jgi:hypothetical protein
MLLEKKRAAARKVLNGEKLARKVIRKEKAKARLGGDKKIKCILSI